MPLTGQRRQTRRNASILQQYLRLTVKMRQLTFQFCVAVWLAFLVMPLPAYCQVTVILSRHAEKAKLPGDDPPLSSAGEKRAKLLGAMLADAQVEAIFVTKTLRAEQTAKPLADRNHLEPIPYADTDKLTEAVRARRPGVVLVIGHSNTLPSIIAGLGGPAVIIAETDFDNLFILTVTGSHSSLLRLHYGDSPTSMSAAGGEKEQVTQIKFLKSGGFAGMATNVEGTATLRDHSGEVTSVDNYHRTLTTRELELLRHGADPKRLETAGTQNAVPDGFQYEITVTPENGKSQTVTFHGEPPSGQPNSLYNWVAQECRRIWDHRASQH
jgi:phosphohistidine phosphatase SixA